MDTTDYFVQLGQKGSAELAKDCLDIIHEKDKMLNMVAYDYGLNLNAMVTHPAFKEDHHLASHNFAFAKILSIGYSHLSDDLKAIFPPMMQESLSQLSVEQEDNVRSIAASPMAFYFIHHCSLYMKTLSKISIKYPDFTNEAHQAK